MHTVLRLSLTVFLAGLVAAVIGGCSSFGSDWNDQPGESYTALRPGVTLVPSVRGRGPDRERRVLIDDGTEVFHPSSLDELIPYCRPLVDPDVVRSYLEVVRLLDLEDSGVSGRVIRFDATLAGPGASGVYGPSEAKWWNIDTDHPSRAFAGGIEVTHVVLIPPVQHPILTHSSPWRLVELVEVVYPDGSITIEDERVLTNGDDARRFITF